MNYCTKKNIWKTEISTQVFFNADAFLIDANSIWKILKLILE